MRIAIDGRWVSKPVGLGVLSLNLIIGLSKIDHKNSYIVYLSNKKDFDFLPTQNNFQYKYVPGIFPFAEQILLPIRLYLDKVELFHACLGTAPIVMPCSLATTIADVMFLLPKSVIPSRTNFYQKLGSLYRRIVIPIAYKHSDLVATISDRSKADIIKYLGTAKNISTIYLAASDKFNDPTPDKAYLKLPPEYIFAFVAKDPRKNTKLLVESFNIAKVTTPLVLVGQLPESLEESLPSTAIKFDRVSADEIIQIYKNAKFFIYPSAYEGFGIPLVEAMVSGTPIIALKTGANEEIAGECCLFSNPDGLAQSIVKLDKDASLRRKLSAFGKKSGDRYSWEITARKYLKFYSGVAV